MPNLLARVRHALAVWRGEARRARLAAANAEMPRRTQAQLRSLYLSEPDPTSPYRPEAASALDRRAYVRFVRQR